MKIIERKRELYKKWSRLYKDLDSSKMTQTRYKTLRKIETEEYKRWKFFDDFVKAKEKVDYEERKHY